MTTHPRRSDASGVAAFALAVVLACAALAGLLTLTGCLGQQARSHALAPAIKAGAAYAAGYADKAPEVDKANVDKFLAAVDAGDSTTIKATWSAVYQSAQDGIDVRTDVSPAVKPSLKEPLVQLDAAIGRLR